MQATNAHILVVEDDPVTRAKLVGYFESEGYQVSEAEDGQAMWPLVSERSVDLVLLDINLPGEDGLFLTRELRARFALLLPLLARALAPGRALEALERLLLLAALELAERGVA